MTTINKNFNPLAGFPKTRGLTILKDQFNNIIFVRGTAKVGIREDIRILLHEMKNGCKDWSDHRREAYLNAHGVYFDYISMDGCKDQEIYDTATLLDRNSISQLIKQKKVA